MNYTIYQVIYQVFSEFASKFGIEKLQITSGVGLYQNKVENFLKTVMKSELNKNVQGHRK